MEARVVAVRECDGQVADLGPRSTVFLSQDVALKAGPVVRLISPLYTPGAPLRTVAVSHNGSPSKS